MPLTSPESHVIVRDMRIKSGVRTVSEQIIDAFHRLIASPVFYRFSVNNFFTRWFAKYRTHQVFDLMTGFVNFQVLLTCVRLGVLERVYAQPCEFAELCAHTQLPRENLERLILSALSLGLIERRAQNRYGIGPLGLPVVAYPGIRSMVEHNAVLYADMQDTQRLLACEEKTQMNQYWPYASLHDESTAHVQSPSTERLSKAAQFAKYSELMSASQNFVIDEIMTAYDFSDHSVVLDIGCGKGRFVNALANAYPKTTFKLMDLPEVIELTRQNLQGSVHVNRIEFIPANFKTDALTQGADLITLVRVAHDHSDEVVAHLLKKIFHSLAPKGSLLLAEPMASAKGARHDPYFHFYLLAMGEGRLRTPEHLTDLLLQAGFSHVEMLRNPMPMHAKVLVAKKH